MAWCCWAMGYGIPVQCAHKCTSGSCPRWSISNILIDIFKLICLWLWANEGLSCKFVMLRGAEYPRAVLMDDLDGATLIRSKRSYLLSLARYLSTACLGHGYFYNFFKKEKESHSLQRIKEFCALQFPAQETWHYGCCQGAICQRSPLPGSQKRARQPYS